MSIIILQPGKGNEILITSRTMESDTTRVWSCQLTIYSPTPYMVLKVNPETTPTIQTEEVMLTHPDPEMDGTLIIGATWTIS